MALAAKRRVVVNTGRRSVRRNRSRRRNLSPKQIKFFGTPAQKAALKRKRNGAHSAKMRFFRPSTKRAPKRKNVAAGFYDEDGYFHPIRASYDYDSRRTTNPRARNTAKRSRSYVSKKRRAKNPGEILSLVLNPGGTKKGKNMAASRRRKKSSSASGRRSYRRRRSAAKTNPHHRRRRRAMSNPAPRRSRRRNYTRHRRRSNGRRRNPGNAQFMQGVLFLVGGGVGFFGSKALTQMVMQSNNTGITGYFGNAAATAALAVIAHVLPPTKKFGPAIIAGGVLQILYRVLTDNTQLGTVLSSAGMGDYQMQNFVTPQRLVDPLNSAQIEIPTGWGASAPIAISTAAPPGAPAPGAMVHPAGMSSYNNQGFGSGMYSAQGIYS